MQSDSIIEAIVAWLPFLIYLLVNIWLTFKIIRVQRDMVTAQQGILQKMIDFERRLYQKPANPTE
ncbi:hypothetical protein [Aminobacter sp. BE322]|uniref:hypothetical protein n=1 Tax=unclassified Aminobacter TaxID=2644704 RepID=UPI003D24B942